MKNLCGTPGLSKTGTILLEVAVVEWSTHLAHILASMKGPGLQPGSATQIFAIITHSHFT